jgi:hypothetical protein
MEMIGIDLLSHGFTMTRASLRIPVEYIQPFRINTSSHSGSIHPAVPEQYIQSN